MSNSSTEGGGREGERGSSLAFLRGKKRKKGREEDVHRDETSLRSNAKYFLILFIRRQFLCQTSHVLTNDGNCTPYILVHRRTDSRNKHAAAFRARAKVIPRVPRNSLRLRIRAAVYLLSLLHDGRDSLYENVIITHATPAE